MEHKRNDITNSLVHLTKGKDDNSGLDVLCCILNDGIIKGSGKSGFHMTKSFHVAKFI